MVNTDIEFYLDSYLPNTVFSATSIAKGSNPLCALKVKNAVILKLVIPSIGRISDEELTPIIARYLPSLNLGLDAGGNPIMGVPSFTVLNFGYELLTFNVFVRFYKAELKTFDSVEFVLGKIESDPKLKAMIDLLQNEPQNLIRSESNGIYYHKDPKTGRVLACTRKLFIDYTAYKYVGIEESPFSILNSNISKNNLKVISHIGPIITVALI